MNRYSGEMRSRISWNAMDIIIIRTVCKRVADDRREESIVERLEMHLNAAAFDGDVMVK